MSFILGCWCVCVDDARLALGDPVHAAACRVVPHNTKLGSLTLVGGGCCWARTAIRRVTTCAASVTYLQALSVGRRQKRPRSNAILNSCHSSDTARALGHVSCVTVQADVHGNTATRHDQACDGG